LCIIEVKTVHGALEKSRRALAGTLRGDCYRSYTTAPPCAALTIGNERHARDREDHDDFSRLVPEMSHCQQLIHHASAYSCRHVLYVVSSTTTVLYCVLAKFSDALISGQQAAICELYDPHLMYALPATSTADRRQPVPTDLTTAEYGYAKDASLPVISSARLSGCYVWYNREKTPTDSYSKNMSFYGPLLKIQGLTPTGVMGMRLTMPMLHQVSSFFKATQSLSLFETREAAGNERGSRYHQLRREMQRQTLESFAVDGDLPRIKGLTKKNRMTGFKSGEAKTRRLNASLQHLPTLVAGLANGVRCWYCTSAPTKPAAADSSGTTPAVIDGSAPQAFPARPFETNTKIKFCCPSCDGAFLCQVKRIFILPSGRLVRSGKSCHDLWHTRRVLNPLPLRAKPKK
jgi:hypothetical protein